MRTLDEVLTEIIGYYTETTLTLSEAVAKAAPFEDLDDESRERALFAGINHLAADDAEYLRNHPVAPDEPTSKRSYLGKFQLRPSDGARASAVYPHLSIRLDIGGENRKLIEFTRDDLGYVREKYTAVAEGAVKRAHLLAWLDDQLAQRRKGRVSDLPKSVLAEADERAGEVFK